MAKWILILLGAYAAGVLNTVVAPLIEVRGVSPDFLALAAVLGSLFARGSCGVLAAGLAGALADVNAPGRLGLGMALFPISCAALSATRQFMQRRPLMETLATWFAVSAMLTAVAIARSLLGDLSWSLPRFVTGSLATGFYSALLSLPCYWIFDRIDRLRAVAY